MRNKTLEQQQDSEDEFWFRVLDTALISLALILVFVVARSLTG